MIRPYKTTDLAFVEKNDRVMAFELQYHGEVLKDDVFTAMDENGIITGVLFFRYDDSWYGENETYQRLIPSIITEKEKINQELEAFALTWFSDQKERFIDKKAALVKWVESDRLSELQDCMHRGYFENEVCPCLYFNCSGKIPKLPVPSTLHVEELPFEQKAFEQLAAVTKEANNGTADRIAHMWFFTGEPTYHIYVLMDGPNIVASASTWKITEERAAIENIVTAVSCQQRGYAQVIIAYVLARIKEMGYKIATLSTRGRNLRANRLYQKMGFQLLFNQIELICPISIVTKKPDLIQEFPLEFQERLSGKKYQIDNTGMSGSTILLFEDCVCKVEEAGEEAENEVRVMQELSFTGLLPRLLLHEVKEGKQFILMSRMSGKMLCDEMFTVQPELLTELLATGLKRLWSIDITKVSGDFRLKKKLEMAEYNITHDEVNFDNIEPETKEKWGFHTPGELLNWLKEHQPEREEVVLAHGDYCLPNIFSDGNDFTGFIDVGKMGLADKWQDIALCYRSLKHNMEGRYGDVVNKDNNPDLLFQKLGIDKNEEKLNYYIMMDELF